MGIASLSHIGVVLAVVAVFALLWKLKQRRLRGAPFAAAGTGASAPWLFLKALVLAALFAGAMLPVFRDDGFAPVIHLACTALLTLLAGLWLFRTSGR